MAFLCLVFDTMPVVLFREADIILWPSSFICLFDPFSLLEVLRTCSNVLQGLSSKEAELLKDGTNAAKSCSCSKQSTVSTETTKNTDQVTGEEDTPSSSNATLFTPDSQPKMEMDSIPSSSGTAKNNFLKIGIGLKLSIYILFFCFSMLLDSLI